MGPPGSRPGLLQPSPLRIGLRAGCRDGAVLPSVCDVPAMVPSTHVGGRSPAAFVTHRNQSPRTRSNFRCRPATFGDPRDRRSPQTSHPEVCYPRLGTLKRLFKLWA
jgi:hypothetical protein